MPTFEIPDGPTAVDASRSAAATAVYSVTNRSANSSDGRLSVIPSGGSKGEWFTVDGNRERTFAPGESQTVTVRIRIAADAPPGDYPFRLRAIAVDDPDNDHAEGPVTVAKLGAVPVPGAKKPLLWLWILIGVVIVVLIAGALFFMMRSPKSDVSAAPAQTTNATDVNSVTATPAPPPAPAAPAAPSDRLNNGESLKGAAGQRIVSKNGFFNAVMQGDCNFVLYNPPRALWASGTYGRGSACNVIMQGDGNLVVYTENGVPVWASNTRGSAQTFVVMQDDGNLVIYDGGRALWASNTVTR